MCPKNQKQIILDISWIIPEQVAQWKEKRGRYERVISEFKRHGGKNHIRKNAASHYSANLPPLQATKHQSFKCSFPPRQCTSNTRSRHFSNNLRYKALENQKEWESS